MSTSTLNLFGDQILVSVFAQFKEKYFKIPNESVIVRAFYEADKTGKFNEVLKNYTFDDDGTIIRSSALEQAIDSLQQTRLLGRSNPDLKEYKIQDSIEIRYNKFIKTKVGDSEKLINELAKFVENRLKSKN